MTKPVTRKEAILNGNDVTPKTREEHFAKKAVSGGGSGGSIPTPTADDNGKVLTAGADGTASWQTASGGGSEPVTVTNTSFLSEVSTFLTALITASTDTAIRVKRGDTMSGDEELFEAFKSIHENGNPLDLTINGYTFRMRPVLSRTATVGSEVFYYVQFANEAFQYMNNYRLGFDINVSKSSVGYHFELAMSCVKMTLVS